MKRIVRRNPALTKLLPGVVAEAELGAPVAVQFHVVEALRGAVQGLGVGVRRVEAEAGDVAGANLLRGRIIVIVKMKDLKRR